MTNDQERQFRGLLNEYNRAVRAHAIHYAVNGVRITIGDGSKPYTQAGRIREAHDKLLAFVHSLTVEPPAGVNPINSAALRNARGSGDMAVAHIRNMQEILAAQLKG